MVSNKKYIELNNLSAMYDEKTNNISIIGKKNQYSNGFKITLKQGSFEDSELRQQLFNNEVHSLPHVNDNFYPLDLPPRLYQIPLGLDMNEKEVSWSFSPYNNRGNTLVITGRTATGKTMLMNHIHELLQKHYVQSKTLFITEQDKNPEKILNNRIKELFEKENHQPYFVLVDGMNALSQDAIDDLYALSALARSKNIILILAGFQTHTIKKLMIHSQQVFMNNRVLFNGEIQRYGMFIDSDRTEIFQSFLPESLSTRKNK